MISTTSTCASRRPASYRRGSVLIITVGLSMLLLLLSLAFFVRMRTSAAMSELVVRDAQARIMLHAASSYIMEAARLGYASGDPLDHASFERYGQAQFVDYWTGKRGSLPAEGAAEAYDTTDLANPDRFTPSDQVLQYMGGWLNIPVGMTTFNRQNWVGWYTPHHRGLSLTPFHQQSMDVHSWWKSWRQDLEMWEPRMRSLNRHVDPSIDPNPGSRGSLVAINKGYGAEYYFDGARAELTDFWPLPNQAGSRPRLFQMHVREQTPYAVIPHLVHYPVADADAANHHGGLKGYLYAPGPFPDPRVNIGGEWTVTPASYDTFVTEYAKVQGMKSLNKQIGTASGRPIHIDPHLLHYPVDADFAGLFQEPAWGSDGLGLRPTELPPAPNPASLWHGSSHAIDWLTAADGTIQRDAQGYARLTWKLDEHGRPLRQDAARPNSSNRAWFRIYRESHDRFIVTVGGGPSQGWRIRNIGGTDIIERPGIDVDNDTGLGPPFASVAALRQAIEHEARLWYRVVWHPSARQSFTCRWSHQSTYMGGSIKMTMRMSEEEVAALESKGLDW